MKTDDKRRARIDIRIPAREKNRIHGMADLYFDGNVTEFVLYATRKFVRPRPKYLKK